MAAAVQDVLLGLVGQGGRLDGGGGELEVEDNQEKRDCSKNLLNSDRHSGRHVSRI